MSKKSKSTKRQEEEKILYLALTFFLGPAVLGVSLYSLNFVGAGVGVFLEAWGIWGLPEIHPYLKLVPKLIINWKNRKQNQTVSQSPGSQAFQAGRDMTVIVPPQTQPVPDPNQPKIVTGLTVGFEAWGNQTVRSLVYLQASNVGHVSVFIPSPLSLQIRLPDGKFLIPKSEEWETNREFPFELGPGRALSIWREVHGFAASMKKMGYSGTVKLSVICTDEAGRAFEGGPVLFDVDDYAKSAGGVGS